MKKSTLIIIFMSVVYNSSAQTIVYTDVGSKHVVIEEFTGIKCGNCPQGHAELESIISSNPAGMVHTISYNPTNSSYTDPGTTGGTDFRRQFTDAFYTASYCSPSSGSRYMPSAFINRRIQVNGDILQSRSEWAPYASTISAETAPLNIGLKSVYNSVSQNLTIDVEVYFTSTINSSTSVYILISEDSLTSTYQAGSSASTSNPYIYKHTFRENISNGQWGDPITSGTTQGSLYSNQYVFDLTTTIDQINIENAHVLAFVVDDASNSKEIYTGISVEANGGQESTGTPQATGLQEQIKDKKILHITDLLGRETEPTKNTPLFYIYDDGTVEKRIVIE
ncbi:MAG: Omp28-related outer membrane protein [Flavobacteriales bacterium]|nr:Omp28-related outer membrane protein [Flavobacteriales bacterium]